MAAAVEYRAERVEDQPVVREVVLAAFGQEWVGALLDDLRTSDAWLRLSFVAEAEGTVVGHVALTRSLLDAPERLVDVLVLSPMSVRPDRHRTGIGSGLVAYALAQVAERPEPAVFLEGDPAFYGRLGFEPAEPLGFRRPSLRVPPAGFQVRRLPAYETGAEEFTGTLVYHRVWWDHDAVGLR